MSESRAALVFRALACLLLLGLSVRSAAAHALGAECQLRGDRLCLEAYFSDDTAAADARVVVRDAAERIVAKGRTDAKGLWNFAVPEDGLYRITVDAGAGHLTTIRINVPARTKRARVPEDAAGVAPNRGGGGATSAVVSDGPSRMEFTRFPWEKIVLGWTIIALMGFGWLWLRRRQRPSRCGDASSICLSSVSEEQVERESP